MILALAALVYANSAFADYAYGPFMTWRMVDTHHVIIEGSGNFLVKTPYCYIYSSSNIQILSDMLGPWDGKIMVDGQVCEVQEVVRM